MRLPFDSLRMTVLLLACSLGPIGCDKARASGPSPSSDSAHESGGADNSAVDVSGAWVCLFSNGSGSAVSETLILAPEGASAKVSVTGYDAARNHYQGSGSGVLKGGEWNVTFTWNNGATPTWIRVKPSSNGKTLSGRRGKFDDKKYEGDYNCTRT